MNKQLLISCAEAFVSFLFRTPGISLDKLWSIYLFGSVARGDFDEDSDIDIFIDTGDKGDREITKLCNSALKKFYNSDEYKKFNLLGIRNVINVKCGDMRRWELFESIKSEGLILFSPSIHSTLKKHFLLEIKPISDVAKRNRILRKLIGRREKSRKEKGRVEEIGGKILDSRHYLIPSERIGNITKVLSKENALFEMREVWM